MGLAFTELHWSPETFWAATVRELLSAVAFRTPQEQEATFQPFSAEERETLDALKERVRNIH